MPWPVPWVKATSSAPAWMSTDPEPLPAGHPLWKEKRALITPHVAGGNSLEITAVKIAEIALENLKLYLAGKPVNNRLK